MSARERLYEAMAGGWSLTQVEAASLYQTIDSVLGLHAHELAEQQRAWAREHGMDIRNEDIVTVADVIDLIDPHVSAGPVRPDEETT